ncbi:peptide ABC transporter substrate-binding protein [Treponema sp.]|uniref:peptide ABC transporter substrate-binding protein n=1 Tax=Treponema sp. TaxID=166 RepID=UPI003EFFC9B8
MKKFFAVLFLSCVAAAVFPQEMPEREVVICAPLHVYDMNPHTAAFTAEAQLFTGLYEGLFSYDPVNLAPLPAICSSYKISRDRKRWTFFLRNDAKFSDGTLITAHDVKNSWLALLATPNAPFASLLDCISGASDFRQGNATEQDVRIEARDDFTLVVHLNEPTGHLPNILCHHSFSVISKNQNAYSGAFFLKSADSSEIVLEKNEFYWDSQNVKIPAVRFTLSDDYTENSYRFNNAEIDWIMGNADASKIIDKSKILVGTEFGTVYLFFKIQNNIWAKKEFRDALLEAIPYDKLRAKFNIKAETFIYPLPGYPEISGISDYDENDALKLMEAARAENGISKDERLTLLFATTGEGILADCAQILKEAWAPLGVDLKIQTTTFERYNASIPAWNADLFHYSWIGDFADPLAFLELFRGDSSLNVSGFKNQEFDSLLKEASKIDSISERYKLMAAAEQILLNESVVIPVSHPVSAHIVNTDEIGGWKVNGLDIHPLKYLYITKPPFSKVPNLVRY